MILQPLSPDGVHPQISSSMRLLVLCHIRSNLFVIYYCLFVCFVKEFISFIGSLEKCHTSVFNTLIFLMFLSSQGREKLELCVTKSDAM